MKKEMLEAIKNLDKNQLYELVDGEVKEKYIDSYLNSSFQGWIHRIVLESDGNMFISGSMSINTSFQSFFSGDSVQLAKISAWNEINGDVVTSDVIEELTEEEKEELWYRLEGEYDFNNLQEQAEEEGEEFTLEYICNNNMCLVENAFSGLFPKKYEELQKDYIEAEWDYYKRDQLIEEIENTLDELIRYAEVDE